jgi:hypothetical protein
MSRSRQAATFLHAGLGGGAGHRRTASQRITRGIGPPPGCYTANHIVKLFDSTQQFTAALLRGRPGLLSLP